MKKAYKASDKDKAAVKNDYQRYKELRENGENVEFFSQESKFDDSFDIMDDIDAGIRKYMKILVQGDN